MIVIPASLRSDFIHMAGMTIHIALESTIHIVGIRSFCNRSVPTGFSGCIFCRFFTRLTVFFALLVLVVFRTRTSVVCDRLAAGSSLWYVESIFVSFPFPRCFCYRVFRGLRRLFLNILFSGLHGGRE